MSGVAFDPFADPVPSTVVTTLRRPSNEDLAAAVPSVFAPAKTQLRGGAASSAEAASAAPTSSANNKPSTLSQALLGKIYGECLARLSARSLLMKVWKPSFYIFEEQNTLLVFRERSHYLDFKSNPFLSAAEREYTVKKRVELEPTLRCLPISRKRYSGLNELYYFAMEKMHDFGPVVIVKFGSAHQSVLEDIRQQLNDRLQALKRAALS